MLKEKKKLLTKVESLNRKVQNLQAKLAAAKASNVVQQSTPKIHESPVASSSNTNRISASAAVPESRPRAVTVAQIPSLQPQVPPTRTMSTRVPAQRIASGPSSLPRPKTPERNRTPVFKARTPERLEVDLIPESTLIGKKRAAPDDFEGVENTPAHAFSADGKDAENRTPRVRRVLSSLQSSFTPNRNSNRPPAPLPSPKRPDLPLGTAHMYDMTNSPFSVPPIETSSAKPSKRSWLGKIRGASQAVGDKPSSNARHFLG
jgi:myosin protein heavy chain